MAFMEVLEHLRESVMNLKPIHRFTFPRAYKFNVFDLSAGISLREPNQLTAQPSSLEVDRYYYS
jgi:hypothetical protein